MSYPRDLEDYTEEELHRELARRARLLAEGRCAYCTQLLTSHTCKFAKREAA